MSLAGSDILSATSPLVVESPLTGLFGGSVALTLPFDDPVAIFGLAVAIFLIAPLVLKRYRLPGIVGIILVGAVIGPNGLHLLERGETIQVLGEVGLIYLLFIAGLEINLTQFVAYRDRSIVFGLLSFSIPQAVGTVVGVAVLDLSVAAASLFAAIFSSHTLLAYPVVTQLGIAKNEAITATIGGTILTDTLALLVLAVVIAAVGGDLDAAFWVQLTAGLAVFFVGVWLVVPRLGRWFFRIHSEESYFEYLFVLAVLFGCAILAELVGVEHIIGAFLAGLALNRLIPETGPLMNRIEFVGNALFIPFFLLSVGMLVDARVFFEGAETLLIAGSLLGMVVTTKYLAAWATGRLYDYDRNEVYSMFGLSVGQAAAALAIVQIGFEAGVGGFNQHMINGVVVMILVVSLFSPTLVQRTGAEIARAREREPYDPDTAPQRILVPVAHDSRAPLSLLGLAMAIRDERADEPIHAVTVVRPETVTQTAAAVGDAETRLETLTDETAAAAVPLETHTRVNHNIASGIVGSAVDNRITTLVIGWDGARARTQRVFGHVIDQVLRRTTQLALVARIRDRLNTTQRIVLVLPPNVARNDGIAEALHTVALVAEQTGAPIHGVVVAEESAQFERLMEDIAPEQPVEFDTVADWDDLTQPLRSAGEAGDLIVCLSSRRTDTGWHPELQTLPARIARLTEGNFVILYPAVAEQTDDRQFLRFS
ncbi:sodium/hydrogen exchanger [Natrialba chahannaoensis JCM 10990]|uniref:Sodium/hydrogen exchanger n=1 Tax=Natrialba chahannaoensis JCM 10990 TaxID=1227492 RepID=M0AWS8_9EURY|nr:cation:proton antiporter [Natrialba chahannaoensis]ELZ03131.1 sodium/hydrogen exchanger [Natrialba chahannaoensis JCM 10990]